MKVIGARNFYKDSSLTATSAIIASSTASEANPYDWKPNPICRFYSLSGKRDYHSLSSSNVINSVKAKEKKCYILSL